MPVLLPDIDNLISKARDSIRSKIGITNWSDSSVARMLLETPFYALSDLWYALQSADQAGRLETAVGSDLDSIGAMFNVTRLPAVAATSYGQGPSVMFTNSGGSPITVAVGTRVWPSESPSRTFYTTEEIVVPAGGQGYATVRAALTGPYYNVASNTIDSHNLTQSDVTVLNTLPITNGSSEETDAHYRARISDAVSSRQGGTESSIREACLAVPGVRDAIIHKYSRGARTLDITLLASGPVSQSMIDTAQALVGQVVAFGIEARVSGPTERGVDLSIALRMDSRSTTTAVRNAVAVSVRAYIDNLLIETGGGEGTLYYNELVSRIQNVSPYIVDCSVAIKIDGQLALHTNQTLNAGERFVVTSVSVN